MQKYLDPETGAYSKNPKVDGDENNPHSSSFWNSTTLLFVFLALSASYVAVTHYQNGSSLYPMCNAKIAHCVFGNQSESSSVFGPVSNQSSSATQTVPYLDWIVGVLSLFAVIIYEIRIKRLVNKIKKHVTKKGPKQN